MSEELISFLVSWVPTILFIVMLLFFVILGFLRGFRKSLILAIQALVIFIICIIVFFVLVNDDDLDTSMYPNISFIFKSVMSGWPDDASSLREAIGLYIIEQDTQNSGLGSAVQLVIADNGAYFAAMINMVYRMIFAVFITIIYFILLFIMYMIYLIAYPERRHKQKVQMDFSMKKRYKMYRKRRILGATVGLVRGLVSSIIVLAFLGTSLYLISGSSTETEDINFGDDDLNEYYDLYECISDYDECGVYAILNSIKDSNEVPYYLYIADVVLSGKAKVINSNGEYVSTSFAFTSDFANYSKFLKKTINLVIKYADDDFVSFLISYSGDDNSKSSELMNKLTTIFGNEDFQKEFTALISDFDEGSFLINFGLSLIDTIAANYETFLTVDDENTKKILDILFDKENGIKVSNILTKEDAINLATTLIKIIGNSSNLITDDGQISQKALTALALDNADLVVDTLSNLSCINDTTKKTKFNNIFSQIFDLLINEWSATTEDGTTTAYVCYSEKVCKLANVTSSDVDWANEVKSVIKVLPKAAVIYESIDTSSDDEMLESIFNIFSTDNENYQKNEEAYDEIVSLLGDSKVIGALLSVDPIYEKTFGSIETSIEEQGGTFILGDISYANEKDNDGNITTYGETHNMLVAIKALLKAKSTDDDGNVITAKTIYDIYVDGGFDSADDITQMISLLLSKDSSDKTTTYYVSQSKLVRTVLSAYISTINLSNDETKKVGIYISIDDCDVISDSAGNTMKLINSEALDSVLEGVDIFVKEYPEVFNSLFNEDDDTDILSAILANDKLDKLISVLSSSQIIEGTVASYLIVMLEDYEEVELPKEFSNVDDLSGWLSTSISDEETSEGELIKLIKAVKSSNVEITKILGSGNLSYIFNDVLGDDEKVSSLLTSDMLWLIISGMIQSIGDDSFKIIVPISSQEEAKYTDDGEIKNYTNSEGNTIYAIKKDEIVDLTNTIKDIVTIEGDTITVDYKKIFNKTNDEYDILESEVMSATIVATLILNLDNIKVNDTAVIVIPDNLSKAGTNDELKNNSNYDSKFSNNPWSTELPKLLDSIDLLLEISTSNTFSFDSIDSDKLLSNISSLNDYIDSSDTTKGTKLDTLYESEVIKETLTKSLSTLSDGMVVVSADALGSDDYITKDELKNIFKLLDGLDLAELSTEINSLSLNTNNTTYIVNSNVLLATITKYIIENEDTANIVIPDVSSAITDDSTYSHISSDEMDKLLTSLLLLGNEKTDSDGKIIYEISLEDISDSSMFSVDSIIDLNDNGDLDTFLASTIVNYSITSILKNASAEGLSIIVPDTAYSDTNSVVFNFKDRNSESKEKVNTIEKKTLTTLLKQVDNIMPKTNGTRTVSIKSIFSNKTEILENDILHATMINYFCTNDDIKNNDNIVIPENYSEGAENLESNFSSNIWCTNSELSNLFDALDLLFNISTSEDDFNFSTAKLDASTLSGMNTTPEGYSETKLAIVYKSIVIKASMKNILENNSDTFIVPDDALDTDKYIKQTELENIFNLLDGKDLDELTASDIVITESNKSYVTESNILLATITNYILDSENSNNVLVIPNDDATYDSNYEHITSTEMENLLTGLISLSSENKSGVKELNINNISTFDSDTLMDLTDAEIDDLFESEVIQYSVTSILKNDNGSLGIGLIIPNSEYTAGSAKTDVNGNSVQAIDSSTLTSLLSNVKTITTEDDDSNRSLSIYKVFSTKDDDGSYSVLSNSILHATMINYFCTNEDITKNDNIIVPEELIKAGSEENLVAIEDFSTSSNNIWLKYSELNKFMVAVDLLFGISSNKNFSFDDITTDTLNSSLSGMNSVPTGYTDTTKLDICYESSILKATFTMNIVKNDSINVPTNALTSNDIVGDYINKTELALLFEIADDITGNNGITDISKYTGNINLDTVITTISSNTYKNNNYIVRALLTTNILDSLDSTVEDIKLQLDCYDSNVITEYTYDTNNKAYSKTSSINVLTTDEITNMKTGLKTIIGTSDNLTVDTIKNYDFTTISLDKDDVDRIYESRILQRVISSKIIDSIDNILDVCYNNTSYSDSTVTYSSSNTNYYQKYILQTEVEDLLAALVAIDSSNTTGKVNVGSVSLNNVSLTSSKVETLLKSNLAYPLVSNTIEDSVGNVPNCAYDIEYTSLISKTEIQNMVDSMLLILNTDSIDVSQNLSVSEGSISTDNIKDIINSSIVWKLTSDKIVELVGSSYVPTAAYDNTTYTSDTYTFISEDELVNLIKVVGTKDSTTSIYSLALDSDLSYSIDNEKVDFICESYIAKAKVSNLIIDNSSTNSIVIPNSLVNKTYTDVNSNTIKTIEDTELSNLLNALIAFGVTNASATDINISLPGETEQATILASDIMKATITSKIKITSSSSTSSTVYFVKADLITDYITNDSKLVLGETELANIFAAIRIISTDSSLEVTLDLSTIATMTEDDQKTILDSNTVRIYVSGLLSKYDTYIIAQGYSKANTDVIVYYNTDSGYSSIKNDSYSSLQIIAIINYLHGTLGII